jgi:hypothetical protein
MGIDEAHKIFFVVCPGEIREQSIFLLANIN